MDACKVPPGYLRALKSGIGKMHGNHWNYSKETCYAKCSPKRQKDFHVNEPACRGDRSVSTRKKLSFCLRLLNLQFIETRLQNNQSFMHDLQKKVGPTNYEVLKATLYYMVTTDRSHFLRQTKWESGYHVRYYVEFLRLFWRSRNLTPVFQGATFRLRSALKFIPQHRRFIRFSHMRRSNREC